MKSRFLLAFCFILLASCYARANNTTPGAGEDRIKKDDVVGGVYNQQNKKPLGNVSVTAYYANKKEKTVLTDASGNFSFDDLKPGTYRFVFEKDGFSKVVREKTITRIDEAFEISVLMEEHAAYDFTPGPHHFFDFE
jgi:hypothetical protein